MKCPVITPRSAWVPLQRPHAQREPLQGGLLPRPLNGMAASLVSPRVTFSPGIHTDRYGRLTAVHAPRIREAGPGPPRPRFICQAPRLGSASAANHPRLCRSSVFGTSTTRRNVARKPCMPTQEPSTRTRGECAQPPASLNPASSCDVGITSRKAHWLHPLTLQSQPHRTFGCESRYQIVQ